MNLKNTINKIEELANNIPNVKVASVSSIYDLNNSDVNYPAIVITQTTHQLDFTEGFMHYGLTIFYVDRLTEDKSNEIDVQSVAISNLGALLLQLYEEGILTNNATFVTFTERFQSLCSGAYATINFNVPISDCEMSLDKPFCNITRQDKTYDEYMEQFN